MGQGLNQKVAQVTAQVFGLDAGQIKITAADTAKVPNTSATAASSWLGPQRHVPPRMPLITIRDCIMRFHR